MALPAQVEHYIVIMQFPIVLLLIIFNAQAVKAFAEKDFRLVAAGWLANLTYLLFGHVSTHAEDEGLGRLAHALPATQINRAFNVLTISFFLVAAHRFFRTHRPELLLSRCPTSMLIGGMFPLMALEVLRPLGTSPLSTVLHMPAVIIASAALFAIAVVFDDTLRARETGGRSKSRLLLVSGTVLYALVQGLALAPGDWPQVIGFSAGLLCKTMMVIGLVGGFVMSAEAAARTEAVSRRLGQVARTVGRITHELGTPIRLLDNQVSTLLRAAPAHGEFARQLEGLENTVLRIDSVIDATLTLLPRADTLIDVGKLASDPAGALPERTFQNTNINTLLQLALMAVKETRGERVFLRTSYSGHCCINCVPYEIVQIFINILRNAYDAMLPGSPGHVFVTTRVIDETVQVSITDDGHGIAPALLTTLFDDGITTRHGPGRGYGMGVVKELVESNGGTVTVDSPASKNTSRPGTAIVFAFPRVTCVSKEERFGTRHIAATPRNRR
jgi:signal transduction histidine kinase